jgi:hypothetical protein
VGNTDGDTRVWVFDPKTTFAAVGVDEDGVPVLTIGDGGNSIELPSSGRDDEAEVLAASRRIAEATWTFNQAVKTRALRPT